MQVFKIEGLAETELDAFRNRRYKCDLELEEDSEDRHESKKYVNLFGGIIKQAIKDYQSTPPPITENESYEGKSRRKAKEQNQESAERFLYSDSLHTLNLRTWVLFLRLRTSFISHVREKAPLVDLRPNFRRNL